MAIKGEGAALVELGGQSQFARLLPLAAQWPQRQLEAGELACLRFAAARFGEGEIALDDGDLLDLPLPGFVWHMFLAVTGCLCLLCRLGRRIVGHLVCGVGPFDGLGGGLFNQQVSQIQLLLWVEGGLEQGLLQSDLADLERLFLAIDSQIAQGQLAEACKFVALVFFKLPVVQGQLAFGQLPQYPLLALFKLVLHLCIGVALGQIQLEIGCPERGEGFQLDLLEAHLTLTHAAHHIEFAMSGEAAFAVDGGAQLIGGRVICLGAQVIELEGHFFQIEGRQPAGFALLALILIAHMAVSDCDAGNIDQ